jgi:uncharacterized membrane protein YbaN (DUF454 family)
MAEKKKRSFFGWLGFLLMKIGLIMILLPFAAAAVFLLSALAQN